MKITLEEMKTVIEGLKTEDDFSDHSFVILFATIMFFVHTPSEHLERVHSLLVKQLAGHSFLQEDFGPHLQKIMMFWMEEAEEISKEQIGLVVGACLYQIETLYDKNTKQKIVTDFAVLLREAYGERWVERKQDVLSLANDLEVLEEVEAELGAW